MQSLLIWLKIEHGGAVFISYEEEGASKAMLASLHKWDHWPVGANDDSRASSPDTIDEMKSPSQSPEYQPLIPKDPQSVDIAPLPLVNSKADSQNSYSDISLEIPPAISRQSTVRPKLCILWAGRLVNESNKCHCQWCHQNKLRLPCVLLFS